VRTAGLYGVTIAWSIEGLPSDPLALLLAMLPLPPAEGPAAIRFDLRPAGDRAAADPAGEGLRPSFFHGIVQTYDASPGFLLWDRASRVRVPGGGAPIVAELVPPDREAVPGSTEVMLQIALTLALREHRLFHLHAAALVHPAGAGVFVVGGSGAGKTTTTLALLEAGYDYLGDDCLFLRRDAEGRAEALAFPRAFHLGPATLGAFPRIAPLAGPPGGRGDKRPVDPRRAYPGRERASLAARQGATLAIFPTIGDAEVTGIAPLAKAEAFGHLLASSAALVIDGIAGREENLGLLRDLGDAAICREIRLGRDALRDPVAAVAGPVGAEVSRPGRVC
jgi:hypothetical protein